MDGASERAARLDRREDTIARTAIRFLSVTEGMEMHEPWSIRREMIESAQPTAAGMAVPC